MSTARLGCHSQPRTAPKEGAWTPRESKRGFDSRRLHHGWFSASWAVAFRPAEKSALAFATRPVLAVVALKSALELAVAERYGWHRDELYYSVAGLHLQGGYVEFPPVTALLAALDRELFGWSLLGWRSPTTRCRWLPSRSPPVRPSSIVGRRIVSEWPVPCS
jgi:hypothetical protein